MCLVSKRKRPQVVPYSYHCYKVLRVVKDENGKFHYYAPFQNVEYTDVNHETHTITMKANADFRTVRKDGTRYIVEGQGIHACETFDRALKMASSLVRCHYDTNDFAYKSSFVVFSACIPRDSYYWEARRKTAEELAAKELRVNLLYGFSVDSFDTYEEE